ncbi:MAG: hypothetical protein WAL71_17275, partial [Terriglobales bacterium]
ATPSTKGKSNGKTLLAEAAPLCCQKTVDRAVVVIEGMTPWSGRSGGHEIDEPVDSAAQRVLEAVNRRWENEYQAKKERIENSVKMVVEVLCQHPQPDWERLNSALVYVNTSLGMVTQNMDKHLERGMM